MAASHVIYLTFLLYATLVAQSLTVYLPESSEVRKTNQLDTIAKQQQKKLQQHFLYDEIASEAKRQRRRHHTSFEKSYDKNDDVVIPFDDEASIAHSLKRQDDDDAANSRKRRELSDWLIAPNTRWCGRGNTANGTYNHLGGASTADKCCRKHDHCQLYIPAMSNRYELFNYRPYTLSHCNCDRRFRTCLKMANDEDAQTIGKLFFNMVQTQCFIVRNEKVCQQRAKDGSCEREYVKQRAYLKNNRKF